jgi:hypothetical protein
VILIRKKADKVITIAGLFTIFVILFVTIMAWIYWTIGFNPVFLNLMGTLFGGLIGGLFTFLGVKLTIDHEKRIKMYESYNKQINVIDKILEENKPELELLYAQMTTHTQNSYENMIRLFRFNDSNTEELPEKFEDFLLESLIDIRKKLKDDIWEIKGNIEWETAEKIVSEYKKLSNIEIYQTIFRNQVDINSKILEYYNSIERIYAELDAYRTYLIDQLKEQKTSN